MKNRLKELRQLHKWSQADLARKLEVSRQSVNGFESGKFAPSLEMACKIASLFNVAIEEIFIYEGTHTMPTLIVGLGPAVGNRVQNFVEQNFDSLEAGVMTAEELLQRYAAGERDFSGLNLMRLNVGGNYPLGANLSGINLSGSSLSESDLTKINLNEANLIGADLSQCLIKNANLSGANLSGANLSKSDLTKINLSEANLSGADLSQCCIINANLKGANLSGANLSNTHISDSNLTGADLTSAKLMNTDMTTGVDLTDANLTNARFCNTAIGSYR